MKSARSNWLTDAISVVWLILIIATYPLVAQAAPMQGDRFTVSFSGLSLANAEFTLGNQLPGGNFLIEDLTIRFGGIRENRWGPSDMLQGFYNPQFNRPVACLDSSCTQFSATLSRSVFGDFSFDPNGWNVRSPDPLYMELGRFGGPYNVNAVPTNGTYTVALNASTCLPSLICRPLFASGEATFALGSQLTGGNYEIQGLTVELALGLFFSVSDMLQGFYNPQVNRLVACLDAGCAQFSGTLSRTVFGDFSFGPNGWAYFPGSLGGFDVAFGQYSISAASAPIPEPQTISLIVSGILAMFIARRRRVSSRGNKS